MLLKIVPTTYGFGLPYHGIFMLVNRCLTCKYGAGKNAIILWLALILGLFPFLYFVFNGVKVGFFSGLSLLQRS